MSNSRPTIENPGSNPEAPLLWLVTDGKAGHENQTRALAENLQALAPFRIHEAGTSMGGLLQNEERASLVIGTGHRTHLALLAAARRFNCPSVVIMKPTIPTVFFDLCFIPEHDLGRPPGPNVVPTKGMLNRVPVEGPPKQERGLILVGGPSRHHGFEAEPLMAIIRKILAGRPGLAWDLTDSRRTPEEFRKHLGQLNLQFHPSNECPDDWLLDALLAAREVWVTEDSMSMIYEALTARARVGLLPMPRKSNRSRVTRSVDRLVKEGWTSFPDARASSELRAPPAALHEASRCAREVLQRFPALA